MSDPAIRLERVSLHYRLPKQRVGSIKEYLIHVVKGTLSWESFAALTDVDLEVARGETLGIVGRNGAGKSSLLKVVAGFLDPSRGTRRVTGSLAPMLELGAGFDPDLTGVENVFLHALLLGHPRREIAAKLDSIVDFSGLGDFVQSPLRTYSTGMVTRLGFAVSTAWVPDILLIDEVFAVGDAAFLKKCEARMDEFRRAGCTILIVSHRAETIRETCSRCLWIEAGRIAADGRPEEVLAAYFRSIG